MPPGVLCAVDASETGAPEYIPPEYTDVPELLDELVEHYASLQMGLPALYYSGRENPPHPEIWNHYFLKMMGSYSKKVYELSKASVQDELDGSLSYLNTKEKEFLVFLLKNDYSSLHRLKQAG